MNNGVIEGYSNALKVFLEPIEVYHRRLKLVLVVIVGLSTLWGSYSPFGTLVKTCL